MNNIKILSERIKCFCGIYECPNYSLHESEVLNYTNYTPEIESDVNFAWICFHREGTSFVNGIGIKNYEKHAIVVTIHLNNAYYASYLLEREEYYIVNIGKINNYIHDDSITLSAIPFLDTR